MCEEIDGLEAKLQEYVNAFCELVDVVKNDKINDTNKPKEIAENLLKYKKNMINIINDMNFLDESEESLLHKVKSYED